MSKAFTSDSDDEDGGLPEAPPLPPGIRHYMTPEGARHLRQQVEDLTQERRRVPSDVEGLARLKVIERQLRFLLPRLEALEVIDPATQPKDRVLFGATVHLTDNGEPATWRIVGVDEMDLDKGWISWMSPLASALLDKCVGDTFLFMNRRLTIRKIE